MSRVQQLIARFDQPAAKPPELPKLPASSANSSRRTSAAAPTSRRASAAPPRTVGSRRSSAVLYKEEDVYFDEADGASSLLEEKNAARESDTRSTELKSELDGDAGLDVEHHDDDDDTLEQASEDKPLTHKDSRSTFRRGYNASGSSEGGDTELSSSVVVDIRPGRSKSLALGPISEHSTTQMMRRSSAPPVSPFPVIYETTQTEYDHHHQPPSDNDISVGVPYPASPSEYDTESLAPVDVPDKELYRSIQRAKRRPTISDRLLGRGGARTSSITSVGPTVSNDVDRAPCRLNEEVDLRSMLADFYGAYDPELFDDVDYQLAIYSGREEALLVAVENRYNVVVLPSGEIVPSKEAPPPTLPLPRRRDDDDDDEDREADFQSDLSSTNSIKGYEPVR